MSGSGLELEQLTVRFSTSDGEVNAVNGIDLSVGASERVAVVGESGSGKSQAFLAVMGLLARNGHASGAVRWNDKNLIDLPRAELNHVRGKHLAMVFQDPMTSLTPHLRIGKQLSEVLVWQRGVSESEALARSRELLDQVQIPDAEKRLRQYPHELSGGMRQRVMIAIALAGEPEILIADEPTTALDVTVQAEVLALFDELCRDRGMALVLITHDLGVVAGLCQRVAVMYAGRIVEEGTVEGLFAEPQHPYTRGLLQSTPRLSHPIGERVQTIGGRPPDLRHLPVGCPFRPRCDRAMDACGETRPELETVAETQQVACYRPGASP